MSKKVTPTHPAHHPVKRFLVHWGAAVAGTVVSAVVIAILLGVQGHIVNQTAKISALTQEVSDLRSELIGVPVMQEQIARLQAKQQDLSAAVSEFAAYMRSGIKP